MNDVIRVNLQRYTAVVLAADRTNKDPITQHTGAACKAFAPVAGTPMVIRVIDALANCDLVSTIILCGPPESMLEHCPELKRRISSGLVKWIPNLNSPSRSAENAINYIASDTPVLLTTADHALLTTPIVQHFLQTSAKVECDATVGTVTEQNLVAAFPGAKRTIIRLRDGGFRGCNLYTFNPKGRSLVGFWQQAENLRKKPWKLVAHLLGFKTVGLYLLGLLTTQSALAAISKKSGVNIQLVMIDDARAGIDVDKVEDLELAESMLCQNKFKSPINPI